MLTGMKTGKKKKKKAKKTLKETPPPRAEASVEKMGEAEPSPVEAEPSPLNMAPSSFSTPKRKSSKKSLPRSPGNSKAAWASGGKGRAKAVDLVTGKTTIEYFFDPTLLIQGTSSGEAVKTPKDKNDPLFFNSKHLFMPCTIIKPLDEENNAGTMTGQPYPGPTLVKTSDGTLHKISDSTKLIPLQSPDDYVGVDDVLHLPQVTEASLLNTLRTRYRRDEIYTAAGPILISINPYKTIVSPEAGESIYSEDQMLLYRTKMDFDEKPPHLFNVANSAYTALMDSVHSSSQASHVDDEDPVMLTEHHVPPGMLRNQSIIISGESGAGKTEATKIIMKFLARITRKADHPTSFERSPDGRMVAALEDRVLSSNPLLETFGNAQTLRNDNSSRFGKFIHIYFNTTSGSITGASISNYLLEKTRITRQVEGERNYHIFYQLLSGADEDMLQELGLEGGVPIFNYLGNRNSEKMEKDAQALEETMQCLKSIGLSSMEQKAVFGMAAAVLHLGNIQFEQHSEDDEGYGAHKEHAKVTEASLPSLKKACELLGLDEDKLSEALLTKKLVINGKHIKKQQTVAMAEDKRDALAKMSYSSLFLWLINCINDTLQQTSQSSPRREMDKVGFIGVLDIYGFECFDVNGFEQLLINYCNEKLQRHFNRHLFEVEQQMYSDEGVDWSYITFNDNRPCLDLIEGGNGTVGILNTLDDAWGGMGSASEKDGKFVAQVHKVFGTASGTETKRDDSEADSGHQNFVTPMFGKDRQFIILHYAGEVRYTADGFVEKNMDTLSNELRDIGDGSTLELTKKVYSCGSGGSSQRSSIRGISVGSQFRSSLQLLVADLERTQPHYIRCVKPNLTKSSGSFKSGEVLKQLRYSGMMEAIRIRREGYGLREEHESFYHRFSVLLNPEELAGDEAGIMQLVKALSKRLHVTDADWQIGHSKIFLRRELADKLERLAKLRVHVAARTLGRFGAHVVYNRFSSLLVAWARFRLHMLAYYREKRAATKLETMVRRRQQMQMYKTLRRAVIQVQAEQRRKLAVKRVRKIRDPFIDMSYKECRHLLRTEHARLDEAVASNNFQLAAELETAIASIKDAVERKRPLTRSLLEKKIEEVQNELEGAVQRKAFEECGPLQDKLEELTAKRADLPTIDELRDGVREAEEKVALAAKKRDFAGAAAAQGSLDDLRNRLAETLAAEQDDDEGSNTEPEDQKTDALLGFESRAQLEEVIADISSQIKTAIQSKDFAKASSLQQLLDERESYRQMFPSLEELETETKAAKIQLEEAVSKKDFAKAGDLNELVAQLEKRLEDEKAKMPEVQTTEPASETTIITLDGERKTFETREELEDAIKSTSALVSESVSAKDFKRADALQADVDKMVKLREAFPSVTELQDKLCQRKREMDAAISSKQFAKAEEINVIIEELERKLAKEKTASPQKKGNGAVATDQVSVKTSPVSPAFVSSGVSVKSVKSFKSAPVGPPTEIIQQDKKVRRLRPVKPVTAVCTETVTSVAKLLASKRANASIIVDADGNLSGILTDTDFTRRVVARSLDPSSTEVSAVMTVNPTCVSMADSAIDALTTMLENRFRHLPVVDDDGCIGGLLDISKCLNDAIAKLEGASEDSGSASTAEDIVKQVVNEQSKKGAQAAELQALLCNLVSKAAGGSGLPSLRSLLHEKPTTVVSPTTSIREAGILMAENRHAALVVDEGGSLAGVFGFKDMMSRAIAKELPLETTEVSEVMTPNPESVSPDISVLEALQAMFDHRILTLPVCEDNGKVVGLVDVMDVIYGCGGAEGWRSVFSSAMDIDDDVSDVSSVNSGSIASGRVKQIVSPQLDKPDLRLQVVEESIEERPVAGLRPSKPIVVSGGDTILETARLLASKRRDAALIVDQSGALAGILTDKDVTCRVVAKNVEPSTTEIAGVMTPNPICVFMSDAAMEALTLMVEKRCRHLPVLDQQGSVVGVLDIAKCLASIIKKLERLEDKNAYASEDAVEEMIAQHGASGAQAAALKELLGSMLSKAMGGKTLPTLRSLLHERPGTIVKLTTSIREAGILMAENRHAALVVDENGSLAGVFGFKDMMSRAVAKELPLDATDVSEVMTPSPEFVSPDKTVLEAFQIMSDSRIQTLPVCEDNGVVVGLVDVMDLVYGCGGTEGWRSVFSSAMELTDDQTSVANESTYSAGTGVTPRRKKEKTVAKLRPSKPNLSLSDDSVLAVAQLLQRKRGDASLVVHTEGSLAGILTDTDFTRRVVARNVDPAATEVSAVMTPNPKCVSMTDSAMEALTMMVENHFRHLPVVDNEGSVVGLLDIGKCLNDAISKLERAGKKNSIITADVVNEMVGQQGGDGAQSGALQALLGSLMSKAAGGQPLPTLRSLLHEKPRTIVSPTTSIREAGLLMAENRLAALVVDDSGCLSGIFSFKDMMCRAIAKELPLDSTDMSEVMTPNPDYVSPDITVLEALQTMYDYKFLTLPVCEDNGQVVGLVDVMDVIYGCGGAAGWRSIFTSAMDIDLSEHDSASRSTNPSTVRPRHTMSPPRAPLASSGVPPHIPDTLEFEDGAQSFIGSTIGEERRSSRHLNPDDISTEGTLGVFKVSDPSGNTHRIRIKCEISILLQAVSEKAGIPRRSLHVQYIDDEGDVVMMTSDDDVTEAWALARKSGSKVAKLTALVDDSKPMNIDPAILAAAGGVVLAVLGAVAFVLLKPKKK